MKREKKIINFVTTSYRDVLAESKAKAKYDNESELTNLEEYIKLCDTLSKNKSRSQLEKSIIEMQAFKAKELIELKTIRRN